MWLSAGSARADVSWDGTYVHEQRGGNELCPYNSPPVVVKNGKFSITWNLRTGDDRAYHVGVIEGTVRDSGMAIITAKVLDPMPAETLAVLKRMDDTVAMLHELADKMVVRFHARSERTIEINSGICSGRWNGGAAPVAAKGAAPGAKPADPTRVKPAPPLAAGASAWDASYDHTSHYANDWRCPKGTDKLIVKQGRFSIPWTVSAVSGRGQSFGDMTIGSLDGSIAASGKVKLRSAFSYSELPPEIADGRKPELATFDYVRALPPTMTFSKDGAARFAKLTFGKDCEYAFETTATFAKKRGRTTSSPSKPSKPSRSSGKPNGAKCYFNSECESNDCDDDRCVGRGLHPEFASGMACDDDDECKSDDCDDHVCK